MNPKPQQSIEEMLAAQLEQAKQDMDIYLKYKELEARLAAGTDSASQEPSTIAKDGRQQEQLELKSTAPAKQSVPLFGDVDSAVRAAVASLEMQSFTIRDVVRRLESQSIDFKPSSTRSVLRRMAKKGEIAEASAGKGRIPSVYKKAPPIPNGAPVTISATIEEAEPVMEEPT